MTARAVSLSAVLLRVRDHLIIARACRNAGNRGGEQVHVNAALKARRLAKAMRVELARQKP